MHTKEHGVRPDRAARKHRGGLTAVAVAAGLVLSGAAVMGFSNAAFTASTSNTGNNWTTGTVNLSSNRSASTPLFSATGPNVANSKDAPMVPGAGYTRTIDVEYSGTVAADITLTAVKGTATSNLDKKTNVNISDGTTTVYNGTLYDMPTSFASYKWSTPAAPTSVKTYTFTITVDGDAPQGATVSNVDFTWTASSK